MPYADLAVRRQYHRAYQARWRRLKGITPRPPKAPPLCGHTGLSRKGDGLCVRCYKKNRQFEFMLRSRYRMEIPEYEARFKQQNGVCAICQTPPNGRRLSVDHDHRTKKNRGLLCVTCNAGIGNFLEQPERLFRAVDYLRRWC